MLHLVSCFVLFLQYTSANHNAAILLAQSVLLHTDKSFVTVAGKVVHQWLTPTGAQSARIGGTVVNEVVARIS